MLRVVLVLFVCLCIARPLQAASQEVERLAKVGDVWFKAKYFHPHLSYRNIDWRAALGEAIPAVRAAQTPDEFAEAVSQMLAVLDDPATHVIPPDDPSARGSGVEAKLLRWEKRDDGTLVVALNALGVRPHASLLRPEFGALMGEIRKAKGILFDLRFPEPTEHSRWAFSFLSDRLVSVLVSDPLPGPARRKVVHHGLARADLIDAGYYTAFEVASAPNYQPFPNMDDHPTVFVLNRHSPWPPFAQAMVAAGKAAAVFEGDGQPSDGASQMEVSLEDGWTATIRLDEWVFPDSSVALEPNIRVAEGRGVERGLGMLGVETPPAPKKTPVSAAPIFRDTYWSVSSDSPYPPLHDRLAAVFQLWGIVEYFYAHRSGMTTDWTGVLKQFIPRMIDASNDLEFHLAIAEMCSFIRDSHLQMPRSNVIGRNFFPISRRALDVRIVEGIPVVWSAAPDLGVKPGDIVSAVDGEKVERRLARLRKYLSASTDQAMRRDLARYVLSGPRGSEAMVEVEDQSGVMSTIGIPRGRRGSTRRREDPAPATRLVGGDVAYIDLSRVAADDLGQAIESFRTRAALVLDLRQGSRSHHLRQLLALRGGASWIARTAVVSGQSIEQADESRQLLSFQQGWLEPSPTPIFSGRIVVLIDENLQSANEGLAYSLRRFCDATLVGGPTTGANGDSTNFVLPGGIQIGLTGTDFKYVGSAGEIQQQRVGVRPDIHVEPTISGLRAGRDEVLDRAIDYISTAE